MISKFRAELRIEFDIITFAGWTAFIKGIEFIYWKPLVILEKYNWASSPTTNRARKAPTAMPTIINVDIPEEDYFKASVA